MLCSKSIWYHLWSTVQKALRYLNEMCIFGSLCFYSIRLHSVGLRSIFLVLSRMESLKEASSNSFWAGGLMLQPSKPCPLTRTGSQRPHPAVQRQIISFHREQLLPSCTSEGISISLICASVFCFIITAAYVFSDCVLSGLHEDAFTSEPSMEQ